MRLLDDDGRWTEAANDAAIDIGLYRRCRELLRDLVSAGATILEAENMLVSEIVVAGCNARIAKDRAEREINNGNAI